jgi:phosphatidate cytidylyltransferase
MLDVWTPPSVEEEAKSVSSQVTPTTWNLIASITMASKSRFASRGAFDALALEESDAEQDYNGEFQEEPSSPAPIASNPGTPSKNTRSARRSAKRNAARNSEVTDSDGDLDVLTTRSGSKFRHPSVPNLKEEREVSGSPSKAKESKEQGSHSVQQAEPEKDKSTSEDIPTMAPPPQAPDFLTQKAANDSPSHALILQQKTEDDIEARKAYWKKIYERTIFSFVMIGGFVGACFTVHLCRDTI